MKKKVIKIILSAINVISVIILIYFILIVNILSIKYLITILLLVICVNLIGLSFINLRKKMIKILGAFLLLFSTVVNNIGSYYLYQTNQFLNNSFSQTTTEINTYYIVTSSSNKKYGQGDIKGKLFYYKNSSNKEKVLKKVKEEFAVTTLSYDNVISMVNDVIDKEIELIVIDKNVFDLISNIDNKISRSDLKILYKFKLKTKEQNQVEKNEAFNIYIKGNDLSGLVDYNSIITLNTSTHEILLTSIPRDYYIEIYGTKGKKDSLSHMFLYDNATITKSLEQLFDIKLSYSVNITPEGLVELVDSIGGITYCSDQDFNAYVVAINNTDKKKGGILHVNKGCQELNGMETYAVAHERNSFVGRDRMRQKNCQKIIIAIFEKLKRTNLLANYQEILDSLGNLYTTDLPKDVITDIAKDTIDGAEWKFITQSVDGTDTNDAYISILNDYGFAMIPDTKSVDNARNKINTLLEEK